MVIMYCTYGHDTALLFWYCPYGQHWILFCQTSDMIQPCCFGIVLTDRIGFVPSDMIQPGGRHCRRWWLNGQWGTNAPSRVSVWSQPILSSTLLFPVVIIVTVICILITIIVVVIITIINYYHPSMIITIKMMILLPNID